MDEGDALLPPLPLAGGDRGVGARFKLGRPTARAKALRNEATLHEQLLWRQLKGRRLVGLKFTRQMPIAGYIVDFACREHTLAVELDGSQHGDAVTYDAARTGATYADYWGALHDGQALRASMTYDGVHPNKTGYAAMAPVAEAAIRAAMARPAPKPIVR